jgi:aspartyl-tRNA(Asn)/glutamyl-tRNA(Gln) amidotransferase subunit A
MLGEDILYLTVGELSQRLRKKAFSPVELTQSYLDRSQKLGPKFNAYVTLTPELALEQAKAAEKEMMAGKFRGPLHGIPYALKDLVAVKGYPTTWGAKPFAKQTFDYNATLVEKLNAAGAILIGKAAMIELAGGLGYSNGFASLTGAARNPWNTECWTCGSSSGSGAVVSAGLAPWALGSDTRGSIICPTSWCGLSGMRPSFGRVSRYGAMAIAWTMDKLGPMARSADDCGHILSVIAGPDPKDHDSTFQSPFKYPGADLEPRKPLRIGKLTNVFPRLDSQVDAAVNTALAAMQKNGAHVTEVEMPEGPFEDAAELTILIEAASSFEKLVQTGDCAGLTDPLGQINGYASDVFSSSDYLRVQRVRTILQKRVDKLFDNFDVLAAAGQQSVASRLTPGPRPQPQPPAGDRAARGEGRGAAANPQANGNANRQPDGVSSLCGLPALAVPCGYNTEGLPMALQFMGRAGNDHAVIAAARTFQSFTDWHRRHPKIEA